jgi:hypothetical protein
VHDSLANGTFTAQYDPDGAPVREVWPNGVVVTSEYDEGGNQTKLAYERGDCADESCGMLYDIAGSNAHSQKRWVSDTFGKRTYDYDAAA